MAISIKSQVVSQSVHYETNVCGVLSFICPCHVKSPPCRTDKKNAAHSRTSPWYYWKLAVFSKGYYTLLRSVLRASGAFPQLPGLCGAMGSSRPTRGFA